MGSKTEKTLFKKASLKRNKKKIFAQHIHYGVVYNYLCKIYVQISNALYVSDRKV